MNIYHTILLSLWLAMAELTPVRPVLNAEDQVSPGIGVPPGGDLGNVEVGV